MLYDTSSLSARRAWIEIHNGGILNVSVCVALRKESVDRNFDAMQIVIVVVKSLSARRAWIEMMIIQLKTLKKQCRSPQGERG